MVRISVELPDDMAEALGRAAAERQSTREAVLDARAACRTYAQTHQPERPSDEHAIPH
jgi:metal-responsive CopG/Arc/MetJ family transcriptional regulator